MGYTTDFSGEFVLDKALDADTFKLLKGLATTRRMKRRVAKKYGIVGEFFIDGKGYAGQDRDDSVLDYNTPPSTQPSLWLQWIPYEDGTRIVWDGGEKFYNYIEWIEYLIKKILKPRGYTLNGVVHWEGEDRDDIGTIHVHNNKVLTATGHHKSLISNAEKFIEKIGEGK